MGARVLLVGCATVLIAFAVMWIFQPTIHYFQSMNVNTMTPTDYTLYDRYNLIVLLLCVLRFTLQRAHIYQCRYSLNEVKKQPVGLSIIVPAYNEVTECLYLRALN